MTSGQTGGEVSWRQRTGLRRALFVALALSLVLPGLVAGFILIYLNLQRTLEVDTRVRAEKFADLLQAGMTLPLWQISPDSGKPLLEAVATDPSVAAIDVLDSDGNRVLEFHRDLDGRTSTIVVSRPIVHKNEVLGLVALSYSTSAAHAEAARASILLFAILAIQLLASLGLIGAWLTRRVLRPLEVLRSSADRIAAGDLSSEVPALPKDEFGVLSARLDAMRNSLAQSVTQLEDRVEVRTHELMEVNARLHATLEDLRRAQNCLVQSEKLASLGSLVAGIAHELNTPIGTGVTVVSTISERCSELRRLVDAGIRRSQLETFLGEVEKASALAQTSLERAARLVQDFKQVAVDQTSSRRRKFELAEMTREVMAALTLRHKHAPVQIRSRIPGGLLMDSYPGALEQVIANLVDNAVVHGASGRSGCVIEISAQTSDDNVTATVTDDGNGIPPENISRIFDPFFTTQLGLSIAYGLVTGMLGGQISVCSTLGQGTTFTLELPLVAPDHREINEE
jgi:signal transduction histidine kinase